MSLDILSKMIGYTIWEIKEPIIISLCLVFRFGISHSRCSATIQRSRAVLCLPESAAQRGLNNFNVIFIVRQNATYRNIKPVWFYKQLRENRLC